MGHKSRLSIEDIPSSVENLYQVLCNLTNIRDLPADGATLKVLFTADDSLDSTLDTGSLSSPSSADFVQWPDPFPIPKFSHDVELQLKEANCRYAKDGSVTVTSKTLKTDILDTLADCMSKISAYPERQHYENVAKTLVERHPYLQDPGSEKGWYSWFHSLKFKMGNYRQKLSSVGCPEVVINKRKSVSSKGETVKKSKKGEVNYCPDPPEGQSPENMEVKPKIMEAEMQKKDPNYQLLEDWMVATFSQHKFYILSSQIRTEFTRIVTKDLLESFLDGLDDLVPRLLEVYKADTNERRRAAVLLGLPHYISGEDPSTVIRICDVRLTNITKTE
uniref:Uncharacterized protein n=1 Tax=Poecilia reticulata TaxID=8081 RepID=A0A3P9N304_POERE